MNSVWKMEISWPRVLPPIILILPTVYITQPPCIPIGRKLLIADNCFKKSCQSKLSVTEVPPGGRAEGSRKQKQQNTVLGSRREQKLAEGSHGSPLQGRGEGRCRAPRWEAGGSKERATSGSQYLGSRGLSLSQRLRQAEESLGLHLLLRE